MSQIYLPNIVSCTISQVVINFGIRMFFSHITLESRIARVIGETIRLDPTIEGKVSSLSLKRTLVEHPAFPEVRSVADALTHWRFKNAVVRLTKQQLEKSPFPFVAVQNDLRSPYILVRSRESNHFQVFDGERSESIHIDKFFEKWSGLVIVLDESPNSGDKNFILHRCFDIFYNSKLPLLSLAILLGYFVLVRNLQDFNGAGERLTTLCAYFIFLLLSISGLFISYLLILVSLDREFAAKSGVCGADDGQACTSVLDSPGARLFGLVSWAEIGFVFFLGVLSALVVGAIAWRVNDVVVLISYVSCFSAIYPIYSVLYQWIVVKKWCRLCLSIQAILIASLIISVALGLLDRPFDIPYDLCFVSIVVSLITYFLLIPILKDAATKNRVENSLNRFRRDESLIKMAFRDVSRIASPPDDTSVLHLGNRNAKHVLTVITNPFCRPCALAHAQIEKLIDLNPSIRVEVFVYATQRERDLKRQIGAHWIALAERGEDFKIFSNDWYNGSNRDFAAFRRRHAAEVRPEHFRKLIEINSWIRSIGVTATPSIFLNGKLIPEPYTFEDLNYFLYSI